MKVVIFCHSLVSDWNHGNAHFLRGIASELIGRGHELSVLEPRDGWSRAHLRAQAGPEAELAFARRFPLLSSREYVASELDLDAVLDDADLVLVHEWNEPALVARLGRHRERVGGYALLFHDTHHRAVTAPEQIARMDLSGYDGVLAFGDVIRRRYLDQGWAANAWTWHEAADVRVFAPEPAAGVDGDLVWVGNWGDDERSRELGQFLLAPAQSLRLRGAVYGVRYPRRARERIARCGLSYRGWIANHDVPAVFASHRITVHVPRRPYARALPGVPTIRMFEALACGIPLVSAPWEDSEGLFSPGDDYLVARDGGEMADALASLLADPAAARAQAERGRATILARHTCAHRVQELEAIVASLHGVEQAVGR
jgi:spore maturation protein CgeB